MKRSKGPFSSASSGRTNPWISQPPLLAGIIMVFLVVHLLSIHRAAAAGFFHVASAAAIAFSFIYSYVSRHPKPRSAGRSIAISISYVLLAGLLYFVIGTFFVVPFNGYIQRLK